MKTIYIIMRVEITPQGTDVGVARPVDGFGSQSRANLRLSYERLKRQPFRYWIEPVNVSIERGDA